MGEERLPQRVMFGELVGGKGYSGRREKDWMAHLKQDMSVFGMKFEGWQNAAQKAGRWVRRVEEGAELLMQNWHETERCKAAEQRAKAAAAPSTVDISKRPGGPVYCWQHNTRTPVVCSCKKCRVCGHTKGAGSPRMIRITVMKSKSGRETLLRWPT